MREAMLAVLLMACGGGEEGVRTNEVSCGAGWGTEYKGYQLDGKCAASCQTYPATKIETACNVIVEGVHYRCDTLIADVVDDGGMLVCCGPLEVSEGAGKFTIRAFGECE
jgi:hypothetical protein